MAITTLQELRDATRNALDGAGVKLAAVDDALYHAGLQIIPTVTDDRYWRLHIGDLVEPRVVDSEDLPRDLALALGANPGVPVMVRPADKEEARAYALLGEAGLRELDERRRLEDQATAEETAAALNAALGRADG